MVKQTEKSLLKHNQTIFPDAKINPINWNYTPFEGLYYQIAKYLHKQHETLIREQGGNAARQNI